MHSCYISLSTACKNTDAPVTELPDCDTTVQRTCFLVSQIIAELTAHDPALPFAFSYGVSMYVLCLWTAYSNPAFHFYILLTYDAPREELSFARVPYVRFFFFFSCPTDPNAAICKLCGWLLLGPTHYHGNRVLLLFSLLLSVPR